MGPSSSRIPTFRSSPLFNASTALPRAAAASYWGQVYRRRLGVRLYKQLHVSSWRRGRTAFILGSGPSINELTSEQWGVIANGTSIGFNWWTEHPHVPDLYVFENVRERNREALMARSADYATIPLVLKQQLSNFSPARHRQRISLLEKFPRDMRARMYLTSEYVVPGRTEEQLAGAFRLARRSGLLRQRAQSQWLLKRTGSLTFLVSLCLRAGFEQIVLCGVDLNRPGSFHAPTAPSVGGVHETEDPHQKVLPISRIIATFDREITRPLGVELSVAHPASALAGPLGVYSWCDAYKRARS
jgi:hypothetical protein